MKHSLRSLRSVGVVTPCLAAVTLLLACSSSPDEDGGSGGTTFQGAGGAKGGTQGVAGAGSPGTAGMSGGLGGFTGFAGSGSGGGGIPGAGQAGQAGQGGHFGGAGAGGHAGSGTMGGAGRGGTSTGGGGSGGGSAGGSGSGGGGSGGDACAVTTLPSGGTEHASNNASGMAAGLAWTIWSNTNAGSITTYDKPAFSAKWNNAGDFLARVGLQWNASKTYDQYGTITAQFNSKKSGTAGGYSYIGMYGWSVDPCVEWYVVDDSWNKMPVNPGSTTNKGTADIDDGKYTLYTRNTTGTGGSKCPGTSQWLQFYSVRQTARSCGQISLTKHFDAWKAAGMTLGKMDQAQILVEVGGGQGSVEFPVANVTAQ
jgi:hypothetical protein